MGASEHFPLVGDKMGIETLDFQILSGSIVPNSDRVTILELKVENLLCVPLDSPSQFSH